MIWNFLLCWSHEPAWPAHSGLKKGRSHALYSQAGLLLRLLSRTLAASLQMLSVAYGDLCSSERMSQNFQKIVWNFKIFPMKKFSLVHSSWEKRKVGKKTKSWKCPCSSSLWATTIIIIVIIVLQWPQSIWLKNRRLLE